MCLLMSDQRTTAAAVVSEREEEEEASIIMDINTQRKRSPNLISSCLVATTVLLLTSAALVAVFFTLFRPKSPKIIVDAVHLPQFASTANNSIAFTFAQYAAVQNPNRAAFSHYYSTLELVYGGAQVGFMFIPAGEIDAGRTQYMSASFSVGSVLVGNRVVEMESRMVVKGKVRVLGFLTHHVEASAACRVGVSATDGSVLGLRC